MTVAFAFFFEGLYKHCPPVREAFAAVCTQKLLQDGYVDMGTYFSGKKRKAEIFSKLEDAGSRYKILYEDTKPYPKKEDALSDWQKRVGGTPCGSLSQLECEAIVNWVYKILANAEERKGFTKALLRSVKETAQIANTAAESQGFVYNSSKVELNFLESVEGASTFVSRLGQPASGLFFRGHADANYRLCPSVMRTQRLLENESRLYNDLLVNCPEEFANCPTHLEKLVKMQHYGLPTRLLDITRNLLVALFFACEGQRGQNGEVILLCAAPGNIEYPQSDAVTLLASLPVLPYATQKEIAMWASSGDTVQANDDGLGAVLRGTWAGKPAVHGQARITDTTQACEAGLAALLQEVQTEKPAFRQAITKPMLLQSRIVYAAKNNRRIVRQDGAFILCALSDDKPPLGQFRYRRAGKTVIMIIKQECKAAILQQLETFSINRAGLVPEIECVAEYLRGKYAR